jgi:hypothetical protein
MGAPSIAGFRLQYTAKGDVLSDGEIYTTVGSTTAQKVTVFPSTYTYFRTLPVRSGTGVWSVTLKEAVYKVLHVDVKALTTAANYVGVIMQPTTTDSTGRLIINWTFVTVGTATPADIAAAQKFNVYFVGSLASIA